MDKERRNVFVWVRNGKRGHEDEEKKWVEVWEIR